jgi:hypothetical protein
MIADKLRIEQQISWLMKKHFLFRLINRRCFYF